MTVACMPSVALPEHRLTVTDLKRYATQMLGEDFGHLKKIHRIIENAGVQQRYIVRSPEEALNDPGFGARNDLYIEAAKTLCTQAAKDALENAKLRPSDVDLIITTSCTGFMIPSICAHLIPELGMKRSCKRMPITELGCAAGAVALSRAREFCAAYPGSNVLIVAFEFCSLTFQPTDISMQALVSGALFGDGVAACVVRDAPVSGLKLLANDSFLFEDSWHYMGFDVRDTGFHIVLDKGIPGAVERQIAPCIDRFLDAQHIARDDVDFFCIHPGGRKLIEEIEAAFGMDREQNAPSRDCLRDYGNLSSASVLLVLRNIFKDHRPKDGQRGLLAAFGPGFSAEMTLGQWVEA